MDENKRQRLIDIGYSIGPACGTCAHGKFHEAYDFGDCRLHAYRHLKHSTDVRDLSVFRYVRCPNYGSRDGLTTFIHGFAEFVKG